MSTRTASELDDLIRRLTSLAAASPAAARVRSDLAAAAFHRTRTAADKPVIALVGGTGVGKSSLVNRLIGADVTATSFRRTFTAGPVAITSGDLPAGLFDLPHADAPAEEQPPRGEPDRVVLVRRTDPLLNRVTLVDSPDVDGERPDHHAVADRVFRWADSVVFVVTPEKYQMTELQPYYRLAARYAIGALFVMNKADSAAVVDDYADLLRRSGVADARVRVVPRDDASWQPQPDAKLTADDLRLPPAASRQGLKQRVLDATARAGDQVLQPLLDRRRAVDRVVGSVRAFGSDVVDIDVHPLTEQLQRRMRDRSVLYLIGPQRILDRVRSVPTALVRLPRGMWDWARGGEFKMPNFDTPARGEPPDFKSVLTEQFQTLQSRIEDVVKQSPVLAEQQAAWKLDVAMAGAIADDEVGQLRQWLETRWNANPRDTLLLLRLLKLVPGGERVTKYFEAAPYLLAVACMAHSAALGHIDLLVLGGYSAFTWLTEKLNDEVAARARQANNAITSRYERLATQQIDAAVAWLDGLAPPARVLEDISASIERVRAEA
ncbi:MAG TPA: GTPase domain-containing protein [Tepidisphaeraceae bacterium]|jgi:hypothetical protein